MKLRLALLLVLPFLYLYTFSQDNSPAGNWEGELQLPSQSLDVFLELKQEGKRKWSGTVDTPEQKMVDVPLVEIEYVPKERKLKFRIPDVPGNANFNGKLSAAGDSLIGFMNQRGYSFPMKLGRPDEAAMQAEAAALEKKLQSYRLFVDSLLAAQQVPGVAIAMVKDGEVVMAEGFGYRDLEAKTKADGKTLFGIGSCSKAFTSMCLTMLADEGKLDWNESVKTYLPDFELQDKVAEENATAIDLMTHRIGLPRHDLSWMGATESRAELFARLKHLEPTEQFRNAWQYQNFMYMTAGMLGGKLHGGTWEEMLEERIFKPLEMEASNATIKVMEQGGNVSKTYQKKEDVVRAIPYRNIDAIGPAGSINSNAEEMAHWLQFHVGGGRFKGKRLISTREFENNYTPYIHVPQASQEPLISAISYGLGWMVYRYRGHRAVNHGGNIDGFSAEVFILPEDGFGIAVMTNLDRSRLPSALCFEAADRMMDFEHKNWAQELFGKPAATEEDPKIEKGKPIPGTRVSREMALFAGVYYHPGYGKIEVREAGDSLVATHNGFDIPLRHWHYDVFMGRHPYLDIDFPFNFRTSSDGYISGVETPLEFTLDPLLFEQRPPERLSDPAFLANLTGEYKIPGGELEVTLTGNTLSLMVPRQPEYKLAPVRGTTYKFADYSGFSVEFVMDGEDKEAVELVITQPGAVVRAKRQ